MSSTIEFLSKGGPIMVPIGALSVLTITCALERTWFWWHTIQGEKQLVSKILQVSKDDLGEAKTIAEQAQRLPIGRFILAALRLNQPTPETFQLAMWRRAIGNLLKCESVTSCWKLLLRSRRYWDYWEL
jgi:biopolymer transport protein ExbB